MTTFIIDMSRRPCPACPHANGDHDADGQCGRCVCNRTLKATLIGRSTAPKTEVTS